MESKTALSPSPTKYSLNVPVPRTEIAFGSYLFISQYKPEHYSSHCIVEMHSVLVYYLLLHFLYDRCWETVLEDETQTTVHDLHSTKTSLMATTDLQSKKKAVKRWCWFYNPLNSEDLLSCGSHADLNKPNRTSVDKYNTSKACFLNPGGEPLPSPLHFPLLTLTRFCRHYLTPASGVERRKGCLLCTHNNDVGAARSGYSPCPPANNREAVRTSAPPFYCPNTLEPRDGSSQWVSQDKAVTTHSQDSEREARDKGRQLPQRADPTMLI